MSNLRKWTTIGTIGLLLVVWMLFVLKSTYISASFLSSNITTAYSNGSVKSIIPPLKKQTLESQLVDKFPPKTTKVNFSNIYQKRVEMIRNVCKRNDTLYLGQGGSNIDRQFCLDRNHKIFYCEIQKAASTFMRKLFHVLYQKSNRTKFKPYRLTKISQNHDMEFAQKYHEVRTSFKFMFVRDPYARAVSGYVDKLYAPNPMYWNYIGKYSILLLRRNATKTSLKCGHDLTFPEFAKYVIHSETTGKHRDPHFTPMYEHCAPCFVDYNFIGKLETFTDDILFLLNKWNKEYDTNITFADFEKESDILLATNQIRRLYNFRRGVERCMTFHQALKRVWRLLQARGIISKHDKLPISREKAESINCSEAEKIVANAVESITDRKAVKSQRQEVVQAAYNSISKKDLKALQLIFTSDCELFGYDPHPAQIFNTKSNSKTGFSYFDFS